MARTKRTPFPAWQTCKADFNEQRYIRLGNSLLLHPAMLSLSDKAQVVYIHMLLESAGKKEFIFPKAKFKLISGNSTFQKAKNELIQHGFIRVKQNNANLRKPNVYEFIEDWKMYKPP